MFNTRDLDEAIKMQHRLIKSIKGTGNSQAMGYAFEVLSYLDDWQHAEAEAILEMIDEDRQRETQASLRAGITGMHEDMG